MAVGHTRVTANTVITVEPALLWGVILRAAAAASTLNLRDGINAQAPLLWDPSALTGATTVIVLVHPALFPRGIFAEVDANIGAALILWEPLPPGRTPDAPQEEP